MTVITIDTDDKKEFAKAKAIAKKEGWVVNEKGPALPPLPPPADGKVLAKFISDFVKETGGLKSFPKDASAWQREIRKDRKLFGR